jgi:hypothetical protein
MQMKKTTKTDVKFIKAPIPTPASPKLPNRTSRLNTPLSVVNTIPSNVDIKGQGRHEKVNKFIFKIRECQIFFSETTAHL